MKKLSKILDEIKSKDKPKNLSQEFQVYGVYLAEELGDTTHYPLYMKLAKRYNRGLLDEALSYAKGYTSAKSKAKIFMWRLTQLRKTQTDKN